MTSPKHLWSGDWRSDSDAAAEELAALAAAPRPPAPEEEPPPPPEPPPRARRRRRPRQLRTAALIVILALLAAGVGYGLTAAFGTGKSPSAATGRAYLGLQIGSRAMLGGMVIKGVDPGSPAERVGVRAGDVLNRLGGVEVHTPGDVRALMQGRRPGDPVTLGIERGSSSFSVDATLAAQP